MTTPNMDAARLTRTIALSRRAFKKVYNRKLRENDPMDVYRFQMICFHTASELGLPMQKPKMPVTVSLWERVRKIVGIK